MVAGVLYEVDPVYSYLFVGALLVIAAGAAALIPRTPLGNLSRPAADASPGKLHEALAGWRFIRRSPILYSAISLDLFAVLFGGAVALLPALAEDRLGVGATGVGLLRGAGGLGAGLAAVVLAWRPLTRHVGASLIVAVATFGLGTMALGLTTQFSVALVAMVVLSAADGVSVYIRQALVPLVTPRDKLGRVSALSSVSIGASNELGAFESGVAGELLGSVARGRARRRGHHCHRGDVRRRVPGAPSVRSISRRSSRVGRHRCRVAATTRDGLGPSFARSRDPVSIWRTSLGDEAAG